MMQIAEGHKSTIEAGRAGSISIHINANAGDSKATIAPLPTLAESPLLFEYAKCSPPPLPERFPKLTFLAIAVALLVSALAAEFDYLRGAGYYWP